MTPKPSTPADYSLTISLKYSDSSAEDIFREAIPSFQISLDDGSKTDGMEGFSSSNWKVRLAGKLIIEFIFLIIFAVMNSLLEKITSGDLDELDAEVIVHVLLKKPGWKENNFQVKCNFVFFS